MEFTVTLTNVLVTLFYIIPGYAIRKLKLADDRHLDVASAILMFAGSPFLIVSSFLTITFTWQMVLNMVFFFIASLFVQTAFMFFVFIAIRKKFEIVRYRLLSVGAALGNIGFFGLPIVKLLIPDCPEALCYACMYMVSMNLLIFTFARYCVTGDKKFMSFKQTLVTPNMIGLYISLPIIIFGLQSRIPLPMKNAIDALCNMTTPLCMIILGIRLASAPIKNVFTDPLAYIATGLKLLLFPLFAYLCVIFLPVSPIFKQVMLILSAAPCGSMVLSVAELHHHDMDTAAHILLMSTLLCFITIPFLMLVL